MSAQDDILSPTLIQVPVQYGPTFGGRNIQRFEELFNMVLVYVDVRECESCKERRAMGLVVRLENELHEILHVDDRAVD
ncbi:MAG: hypothetical protein ACC658_17660, partial [Acidimicrobiia bacterium]